MNPYNKIIIILLFLTTTHVVNAKKIRIIATGGRSIQNEITDKSGLIMGTGLHLSYPVSVKHKSFNTEFSISNWYNRFTASKNLMQLLRFGFGIRIFCNQFKSIRPYFTHDITSHVVWLKNRKGYAPTFGVLLGLGIDIPFCKSNKESSSLFFDISYNKFDLKYFENPNRPVRFILFSAGYSWKIGKY